MFMKRQFSDIVSLCSSDICGHGGGGIFVSIVLDHGGMSCGAAQRNSPIGGFAYGTDRNTSIDPK